MTFANAYRGVGHDPIDDAVNTLRFLHDPGDVYEICVIRPGTPTSPLWAGRANGKGQIISGWFTDPEVAAKLAVEISEKIKAEGIYTTLNCCKEAIHARAENRLKANIERTADGHILRIKNLLIDFDADPGGVSGVSSSDQQHESALKMAQMVQADMAKEGWPEPMFADSGNGGHLTFAVDLPSTPETVTLIKNVLLAFQFHYKDDLAPHNLGIDSSVFNAARLTKVYGTWVRKGDSTKTRPHRLSQIISMPSTRVPLSLDLLQKMAATLPTEEKTPPPNTDAGTARLDVPAYLQHYGREMVAVKPHEDATLYCLAQCIFDSSHTDGEAAIRQAAKGVVLQMFS